jgi:hypothetical protein
VFPNFKSLDISVLAKQGPDDQAAFGYPSRDKILVVFCD